MESSNKPMKNSVDEVYRLMAEGNFQDAGKLCESLTARFPESEDAWVAATEFFLRVTHPQRALETVQKAVQLNPDNTHWRILKARCEIENNLVESATSTLESHVISKQLSAHQHNEVGMLLARLDQHQEAQGHYRKACALKADEDEFWFNLATSHRFLGEVPEAESVLDRILQRSPLDHEAAAMRSSLRKQTSASNHVAELEATLQRNDLSPQVRVGFSYALAKELEDLELYPQSFRHLHNGASLRRQGMRYDVSTDESIMQQIREVYDAEFFQQPELGFDDDAPIFVIGLPRSGTTLVERILGAHPEIHAAGELGHFGTELTRLTRQIMNQAQQPSDRTSFVAASASIDFQELGQQYIQTTAPLRGDTPHFVDKLPFNYLYAGLIHRALPKARIISLKRHPMDSCYSMYKQLFRDAYPFSYSLSDLGRYYVAYNALMKHWHAVIPGAIHEVSYESLVRDTEGESRSMLEHCGIDWSDDCLDFHRSKAASTTASATQVRQKVYSSSVEKWLNYRQELASLEHFLNSAGINW